MNLTEAINVACQANLSAPDGAYYMVTNPDMIARHTFLACTSLDTPLTAVGYSASSLFDGFSITITKGVNDGVSSNPFHPTLRDLVMTNWYSVRVVGNFA